MMEISSLAGQSFWRVIASVLPVSASTHMEHRNHQPDRNHSPRNAKSGPFELLREAISAMKRSDELNEVAIARSGLWMGEPTLVIRPSTAEGPLDRQGLVKVDALSDPEFRLAVQLRILTREVLTATEQARLDRIPSDDLTTAMHGLYKHIREVLPETSAGEATPASLTPLNSEADGLRRESDLGRQ